MPGRAAWGFLLVVAMDEEEFCNLGLRGLVAEAHAACLRLLCSKLDFDGDGLSVVARLARKRGVISTGLAKKLIKLDTAEHVTRHLTPVRVRRFVSSVREALAGGPDSLRTVSGECGGKPKTRGASEVRDLVQEAEKGFFDVYEIGESSDSLGRRGLTIEELEHLLDMAEARADFLEDKVAGMYDIPEYRDAAVGEDGLSHGFSDEAAASPLVACDAATQNDDVVNDRLLGRGLVRRVLGMALQPEPAVSVAPKAPNGTKSRLKRKTAALKVSEGGVGNGCAWFCLVVVLLLCCSFVCTSVDSTADRPIVVVGEQCTDVVVDYMIRLAEVVGDGQLYPVLNYQGLDAEAGGVEDYQCLHEDCMFEDIGVSVPEGCELIEAFSGFVTAEQLRHGNMLVGMQLTDDELDELIRVADVDGDGLIFCEDLIAATAGLCGDFGL